MTSPPLQFIHVSKGFVVVDKPSGLLSVPGIGPDKQDCVISRVRDAFPEATGPMMVHRLDMDTSGLLIVALNEACQRSLSRAFEERAVGKRYAAVLEGDVSADRGVISLPLRLDVDRRPYQIVDFVHGREAVTRFEVLERVDGASRVRFEPLTGRTHQLRVHSATPQRLHQADPARREDQSTGGLGAPIRGDPLYGVREPHTRLWLHSELLAFPDPDTGSTREIRREAPF
ncbi:MAG: RluA family pseudouridine synthase [Phycisphaerales bacterium]